MSRWRIGVVAVLVMLPLLAWAAVGSYALWRWELAFYAWWPLMACMSVGYLLAWHWQRQKKLLQPPPAEPPMHWTERDRQAWTLVEARGKAAVKLEVAQLSDINSYIDTAREMSLELAQFYHPKAKDPVGNLTIPECLAVVELASHDLAEMVDRYLPGGHLLTIDDWKRARAATEWYQTASNAYWLISAVFNPVQTALRYTASQAGLASPLAALQQHLQLWFYTAYVHRFGTYLIELHSGRLRVGATKYVELLQRHGVKTELLPPGVMPPLRHGDGAPRPADAAVKEAPAPEEGPNRVTLSLVGQVKVGKSSLINALLGEQRAVTDVLPATSGISPYELQPAGVPSRLVLLDTVGYGHGGPREDQLKTTREAARQSDVLLLVLHARNPGRQADLALLKDLREWFGAHPELKRPPVLAVLTHIDLLSPAMEWSPPYDWQNGKRPKEVQIREAVAAAREQLGDYVAAVVPVCAVPGKVHGIDEWVLPAMSELLEEGRAVAMLRALRAEVDSRKVRKVFDQLLAAGKQLVRVAMESPRP